MKKRYIRNWYRLAQTTLDYDNLDEYGNPTVVNVNNLLADDTIEEDEARIIDYNGVEQEYQAVPDNVNFEEHQKEEIEYEDVRERSDQEQLEQDKEFDLSVDSPWEPPQIDEEEDLPDTSDKMEALQYAIKNRRTVELRYSPAGRKNRAIDFGKNVKRIVEPHRMFQASNGNTILTTWDRSVGAIRAFIVDRIQNIVFRDKTTRNPFKQRQYVMPSFERGNVMANINESLIKISSELNEKGLSKSAAVIKEVDQVLTQMKEAQYVGFQGQAIRNRRCWDNCYRNKRAKTPDRSAQVVWFECWDEYLESMKDSSSWDKYASIDKLAKDEKWNQKFSEKVKNKIKSGMSIPEAMYEAFGEAEEKHTDMVLKQAGNLTELAVALNGGGYRELGIKVAEASNDILEAQFGGGFEGAWNKVRRYNPFSSRSRAKGLSGDISTRLKRLTQQALQISNQFNTIIQQSRQSGMAEQGYQQQQQQQQQQRQQTIDKVKAAPGQAFNWLKEKGQQVVNNPVAQQGATALGGSDVDIKTAAPVDPAFAQGANDYTIQLRDEFQTFLEDVRNEAASMSQMSTQTEDQASKQSASQAAQRMMQFVQKATPFEQSFNQRSEMVNQADALVSEMQSFANDINSIQMGDYNPAVGADQVGADQAGADQQAIEEQEAAERAAIEEEYANIDTNRSGEVEPEEAAASGLDTNQSGAIEPEEVAPATPPNFSTLMNTIQQDPSAAPFFERLLSKNSVNLEGMGVLQNVFEQSGVEFNDENRKKLVQTFRAKRDTAKNQQKNDAMWQGVTSNEKIRGKRILAKILNKNKGILKN